MTQAAGLVGQRIGHYRIEELLGSGGMGAVYRAEHVYLGRHSAIKVVHPAIAVDPTVRERFRREARAAAKLAHPNIVLVQDFGQQDELLFLVMELLDEGSLAALLERYARTGERLPLTTAVDLVRQAAEGLGYAHALGLVHRDVKPDNLLLRRLDEPDARGSELRVKVCDFGLAQVTEGSVLTSAGSVVGTPAYMAPEQYLGQPIDARTDVYALGLVLFEAVTGQRPFDLQTQAEAAYHHVHVAPRSPRELRPAMPVLLEEIVLRCLAKSPDERFQTATELAQALTAVLHHLGAAASEPAPTDARPEPLAQLLTDSAATVLRELAGPESERPAEPEPETPAPATLPAQIQLTAEPSILTITTGSPAVQRVSLHNLGAQPDRIVLHVSGVPRAWVRTPELGVPLQPGARKTVALPVTVPAGAVSAPAVFAVTITARSQVGPAVEAALLWEVLVPPGSEEVEPGSGRDQNAPSPPPALASAAAGSRWMTRISTRLRLAR